MNFGQKEKQNQSELKIE